MNSSLNPLFCRNSSDSLLIPRKHWIRKAPPNSKKLTYQQIRLVVGIMFQLCPRIETGRFCSSMATNVNKPETALMRSSEYICSTKSSTRTCRLVLPTRATRPISSTSVPPGMGCVKSTLSDETVTILSRLKRVAVINATSSIMWSVVPPNSVS